MTAEVEVAWTIPMPDVKLSQLSTTIATCAILLYALAPQLSGFSARKTNGLAKDPANFTNISISAISSKIDVKKSKVLDSVNKLEDLGIIEVGNGDTVRDGYRFTF